MFDLFWISKMAYPTTYDYPIIFFEYREKFILISFEYSESKQN